MCHAALARAELMPIYEFECTNEECEANLRYEKEFSINEPHSVKWVSE